MIIKLTGWCTDREIQVLTCMLQERELSIISGVFTNDGFETIEDVSEEIQKAISEYFAPGKPVVRVSAEEKIKILQATVDQLILSILEE